MSNISPTAVLSTRMPLDTKARFAALAARHGLSESALLQRMVDGVLSDNDPAVGSTSSQIADADDTEGVGRDRLTLRLREGDRSRLAMRAGARDMKTSSYLALLVHNHVNAVDVMPPDALNRLKASTAHLAALGRTLRLFAVPNTCCDPAGSEFGDLMARTRHEVEMARAESAAVVRQNLESWESGHA